MSSETLNNLSLEELKKLVQDKNEEIEKLKKEKLIREYKKLQKKEEKLRQENQQSKSKSKLKQQIKPKSKSKSKQQIKPKSKSIPKQKGKTFDEYFQECIKNKRFQNILLLISKKLSNVQ